MRRGEGSDEEREKGRDGSGPCYALLEVCEGKYGWRRAEKKVLVSRSTRLLLDHHHRFFASLTACTRRSALPLQPRITPSTP